MADSINILSLYSGSGMHDEAVCAALRVLGFDSRVLGYVEREASAAAWLMGRMEAEAVESAPVFCGDLADLDARPLRGWVDIVQASCPCQPYSSAGKRLGNADERSHGDGDGPLPHTLRIIAECRPALVWFENVCEWVTGGHFREFGEELCRLGYEIEEPVFLAAEDVGTPHQRERVYILCRLGDAERPKPRPGVEGEQAAGIGRGGLPDAGDELAVGSRERPQGNREAGPEAGPVGRSSRATFRPPMFPPGRTDYRRWAELVARGLDPALMPAIESGVPALADGVSFTNSELLRLGGNGVVPLGAAAAFVHAFRRLNNGQ